MKLRDVASKLISELPEPMLAKLCIGNPVSTTVFRDHKYALTITLQRSILTHEITAPKETVGSGIQCPSPNQSAS